MAMNMSIDPLSGALQGVGMLSNFLTGQGAANKSKQLMGAQYNFARRQLGQWDQLQPEYMSALQNYGMQQGLIPGGPQGYGNTQISPHNAQRLGMDPNTQFTNPMAPNAQNGYLSNPYEGQAFHLRQAAAEQALQHATQNQDQNLMFQLGQRGISTGTQAAALARSHQDALQQYGDWQRNMAINAGDRQQQQQQQWLAMLQGGMGTGAQGAGIMGQQGAMYQNQANQAFGGMGQIAGNFVQNQAMQNALQQLYGAGGQGANTSPVTYSGQFSPVGMAPTVGMPVDPAMAEYLRSIYGNSFGTQQGPMGIGK